MSARAIRLALLAALAASSRLAAQGPAPPPLALVGATLVDGTGAPPVPGAVVLVRGGRITCAGPRSACRIPAGVRRLDLAGAWIIPGLIDAHVHFAQTGWVDGRPDALDLRARYPYERVVADLEARPERFFRAYVCTGVTGVFDVGGYPWTWALRERAERDTLAPHVAAAGPLLSTVPHPRINLGDEQQIEYVHVVCEPSGRVSKTARPKLSGVHIVVIALASVTLV